MALSYRQFVDLTRRLDARAEAQPRRAAFGALGVAAIGYGFVLLVIAVLTALLGILMVLAVGPTVSVGNRAFVAIVCGVFLFVYFVPRPPEPDGVEVTRNQAPALFAILDSMRRGLAAPKFHLVLVDDRLNASVARRNPLRIPGWKRNYLVIGLPLMFALSVDQLSALLAHECAHVWRDHGRFNMWIARTRVTWGRVMSAVDARRVFPSFIFRPFFHWYRPHLDAHFHAYSRAEEYEADRVAARLYGAAALAQALARTEVMSRLLRHYHEELVRRCETEEEPPRAVCGAMAEWFHEHGDPAQLRDWLTPALREVTGPLDTHPVLKDRLAALGETALFDLERSEGADRYLLGDGRAEIIRRADERWRQSNRTFWTFRHQQAQSLRARLRALDARAESEALSTNETFERALLAGQLGESARAVTLFEAVVAENPRHPSARLYLGLLLLEQERPDGIAHVEAAIALDAEVAARGARAVYEFLIRSGRADEAESWLERAMTSELAFPAPAERSDMAEPLNVVLRRHGRLAA